jgi:hypothetical protein
MNKLGPILRTVAAYGLWLFFILDRMDSYRSSRRRAAALVCDSRDQRGAGEAISRTLSQKACRLAIAWAPATRHGAGRVGANRRWPYRPRDTANRKPPDVGRLKEPPDRTPRKHEKLLYFCGAKLATQADFSTPRPLYTVAELLCRAAGL